MCSYILNRDRDEVKRGILELYANDVSRFGSGQAPKIRRLLRTIPGQLSKHEKKFPGQTGLELVLHPRQMAQREGRIYLPLYMAHLV